MSRSGGEGATIEVNHLLDMAARFGVPTFVLVVMLLTIVPKIDHGIMVADRVDGELTYIAATCYQQRPQLAPGGVTTP